LEREEIMKRIVAILLIFALMLALSSCWSSCSDAESGNQKAPEKSAGAAPGKKIDFKKIFDLITGEKRNIDEWDLITGTDLEDITLKPGTEKWTEPDKKPKPGSIYTISDVVIVDNSYVTLSVVEAYADGSGNFKLKIRCKNKTGGTVGVYSEDAAINGYMIMPEWYSEVEPNQEADSEMVFTADKLKQAGITVVEEVEFLVNAYPTDFSTTYVYEKFRVYPTGLDAGSVTYPGIAHVDKGKVFVDNADLKFAIEGVDENGEHGYTLKVYVENRNPGVDVYCYFEDSVIINCMSDVNCYWGQTLFGGRRAVCDAPFLREDFDKEGVTVIYDMTFILKVVDSDDWTKVLQETIFMFKPAYDL
jgi:hypothetical protein